MHSIKSLQFWILLQTQDERDELYRKFVKAIHEVQQKSNFKNLLLEKKLGALADTLEKKEAQLNEVLSASNLDPTALTVVTRKLEVNDGFICSYVCMETMKHAVLLLIVSGMYCRIVNADGLPPNGVSSI